MSEQFVERMILVLEEVGLGQGVRMGKEIVEIVVLVALVVVVVGIVVIVVVAVRIYLHLVSVGRKHRKLDQRILDLQLELVGMS